MGNGRKVVFYSLQLHVRSLTVVFYLNISSAPYYFEDFKLHFLMLASVTTTAFFQRQKMLGFAQHHESYSVNREEKLSKQIPFVNAI